MSRTRTQFCLAWLSVVLLVLAAPAVRAAQFEFGDPFFETVSSADDVPGHNVSAVVQGRRGFIWVGTPTGLYRYDGYQFRRADGPLANVLVRSLLVGADGRVWVGTDSDGLYAFDPGTSALTSFRNGDADGASLLHDTVRALAEGADGDLWVGTDRGLEHLPRGQSRLEHLYDAPQAHANGTDSRIQALLVDRAGDLWIGTWNGLSRRRRATGEIERMHSTSVGTDPLAGERVTAVYPLRNGDIVVGTVVSGAFILSPDGTDLRRVALPGSEQMTRGDPSISAVIQPKDDELWLAEYGGIAVLSVDGRRVIRFLHRDVSVGSTLAHSQVGVLTQDSAGLLWIGGYGGGLQRHDPSNRGIRVLRHSLSNPAALTSPDVSSVLELDNGEIWVGTRDHGVDIIDRKLGLIAGIRAGGSGGLTNGLIFSLAQTPDRSVWIGTIGLQRFSAELRTPLALPDAPPELAKANIRKLHVSADGTLWIGSNVGLARLDAATGAMEMLTAGADGPVSGDINAIVAAPDGRLWIGGGAGAAGLYTLAPGGRELQRMSLRSQAGAPLKFSIIGLLVDRAGRLWIDGNQGLFRLLDWADGQGTLDAVGVRLGLGELPMGANLLEDASGRIWTQRYVFNPADEKLHELLGADGADLGAPWFRSYTKTRDGLLLFGGSRGLMVVDPDGFRVATFAAPLRVTDVAIDGHSTRAWATPAELVIPSGSRAFSVEFAALDFSAPLHSRYEYRLGGYDDGWNARSSERRSADYGNLAPGRYTLHVRAFNRDGIPASNELAIPVRVQAAWWQQRWFLGLLTLLVILSVYAAHRLHMATIHARADELEQRVAERTVQLREQIAEREVVELTLKQRNADLETANENLAGTQSQLLQSEKMASVGQLAAGVAHEINNPIGYVRSNLTSLKNYLNDIFGLLHSYEALEQVADADSDASRRLRAQKQSLDLDYLRSDIPNLMSESLDGIRRVEAIVKDLKDFSHIDKAEWQHVDIHQGLESTLNVAAHELKYKAEVIREYGQLPHIECLPFQLNQVYLNLLVNAAHAIEKQGVITIRTGHDGDHVWLTFSDTGKGIEPKDLKRIFEPFFTTKPVGVGTGLGLAVSYNIIHKHGGSIVATSVVGAGTTFTIRLPIAGNRDA